MTTNIIKDEKKNLIQELTSIQGLGNFSALAICKHFGIKPYTKIKDLKEEHLPNVYKYIEKMFPETKNKFKLEKREYKAFAEKVGNLRALRNKIGLPVRGQRSHTNGKTKGKLKNN